MQICEMPIMTRSDGGSSTEGPTARSDSPAPSAPFPSQEETEKPPDPELEKRLLGYLSDLSLPLPMDSLAITNELNNVSLCLHTDMLEAKSTPVLQTKVKQCLINFGLYPIINSIILFFNSLSSI